MQQLNDDCTTKFAMPTLPVWQLIDCYDAKLDQQLKKYADGLSEHNLVNYLLWSNGRRYEACCLNNNLCVRYTDAEKIILYFPFGEDGLVETIAALIHDANNHKLPWRFTGLSSRQAEFLKQYFSSRLTIDDIRNDYDYIYSVADLIALKGSDYHRIRNHLNRFFELYTYQYEVLQEEHLAEVQTIYQAWLAKRPFSQALQNEYLGVLNILSQFSQLPCRGALLRVAGEIVAFTIGEQLTDDTVVIHIEKANTEYHGAYQAINQLFLEHEWSQLMFVNREPDLGIEGLRKAKMSYRPCRLLEKFWAVPK